MEIEIRRLTPQDPHRRIDEVALVEERQPPVEIRQVVRRTGQGDDRDEGDVEPPDPILGHEHHLSQAGIIARADRAALAARWVARYHRIRA
jgi:hypothetical protein